MAYLQWVLWLTGLALQYLVMAALFAGHLRAFPMVVAYLLCLMATTLIDIVAYVFVATQSTAYANYYYFAELTRQSGLFSVVVSLLLALVPNGDQRNRLLGLITTAAVVFWSGSMIIHYHPHVVLWMTQVTRNLSFCSALLNLTLWFMLISAEKREFRRLMLVGGLGIQMTGEAIGLSIRQMRFSEGMNFAGSMLMVLTHFACLYIWLQAFSSRSDAAIAVPESTHTAGAKPPLHIN